mmetsp:Transcript_6811/g.14221  ORF Transcript_6811/g.14221 Transcript_6811/m.14221 type:complete len:591 (-) Transcript_6811:99-1871(-)|eukprot:CAMPEP_0172457692 /NCGR_PEP_ID=MMETSP1065-20121228/23603_1 /TAXON_ID=265537 /ORGANISM="Amphiprora paludosa, Strain CCMP125" /LENGTH=590 /DNA_ID=CAMNT_0013211569 /DNA_START=356 /DNA_END=2128 /DNA_ORIENTATION=-
MASQGDKDHTKQPSGEEDGIPLHLLKNLRKREGAESGSSNGENNSDNSALVSIGNTSFGFNFDSEEHSPNNSDRNENSDSDGNTNDQQGAQAQETKKTASVAPAPVPSNPSPPVPGPEKLDSSESAAKTISSVTNSSTASSTGGIQSAALLPPVAAPSPSESVHNAAAADAVASLKVIASSNSAPAASVPTPVAAPLVPPIPAPVAPIIPAATALNTSLMQFQDHTMQGSLAASRKRKADEGDSSAGYHTDDEGRSVTMPSGASSVQEDDHGKGKGKKKRLDEKKREERNMREKERSLRISKQISELRNLLSSGGVIVPKGTKSSVLTEAANYIRMLQQHQYRSELDRHQLIQQMQLIGNGAHGAQAARAVRHVAAQNGVWSLGNFGGVPPKSAMSFYQAPNEQTSGATPEEQSSANPVTQPNKIDTSEYKFVFNSCGVGMAIASLGGAFIDCNQLFCQLSNYSKQEVCGLTLFNLTSRQDLQHAFDLISQMISPPMESGNQEPKPIVLRGSMKNRNDIGLSISLVKGEDGIAKCFCATLIKNPTSPFDTSKPIPVSFDAIQTSQQAAPAPLPTKPDPSIATAAPAFTLG